MTFMTTLRFSAKNFLTLLAAATSLAAAPSAHAGFEWKGPIIQPPANFSADVAPQTAPDVNPESFPAAVTAVPVESVQIETAPAEITSTETAPASSDIIFNAPAPAMSATQVSDSPAPAPANVLEGFGTDLPLAIALQQVIPAGYQHAFMAGVNPGTFVSWQGGKPWQAVLSDMLAPAGLSYMLKGHTVSVGGASSFPASAADQNNTIAWTTPAVSSATGSHQNTAPVTIRRQKPSTLLQKQNRADRTVAQGQIADGPKDILKGTPYDPDVEVNANPVTAAAPLAHDHAPMQITPESYPQSLPVEDYTAQNFPTAAAEPVRQNIGADPATGEPVLAPPSWQAGRGQTLRDALKNWSDIAGVELYWSIDYDYRMTDDASFTGSYDEAVGGLLDKFSAVRPQPYGQLHQSAEGPRVLVVKSYDLTN
jgi:hypothetical protein